MFSFAGLLAKQRRHPASMLTFLWVKTGEAGVSRAADVGRETAENATDTAVVTFPK